VELAHPDSSPYATGRRRIAAAACAGVLAAAAGALWLTLRWVPAQSGASATAVAITGDVVVSGGAAVVSSAAPTDPIRSAPMLVRGVTASGRHLVRRFSADHDGRFVLVLPPGTYTFTAVLYQGAIPLSQEPHQTARVRPGQHAHIHITEVVV
jgi:hypothetical protein